MSTHQQPPALAGFRQGTAGQPGTDCRSRCWSSLTVGATTLIASEMVDYAHRPQVEENLIGTVIARARHAQAQWSQLPIQRRLLSVRKLRRLLAIHAPRFIKLIAPDLERTEADTLTAELLPLAEAARYLEKEAEKILAPK